MQLEIHSFFSGLGFLDLGFEENGYSIVSVNELHKPFLDAYIFARKNMKIDLSKTNFFSHSINSFLDDDLPLLSTKKFQRNKNTISGFIGGPPCPDFSIGGKNKGSSGKNGILTSSYATLIEKFLPDFFVFENVKGLVSTQKHKKFYDETKQQLSKNYYLTDHLLNSLEFGVPQDRYRIILIGFLKKRFSKLKNVDLDSDYPWQDGKLYDIKDISAVNWPKETEFCEDKSFDCPTGIIKELTVEHWFKKNSVLTHCNAKHFFTPRTGIEKMLQIAEGDVSRKSFKRLHRWRYSPTACYGNNEVHLHPYKPRRISAAEALAIQSMPMEFALPDTMSLTNMFKGIGNGVPFAMASQLARNLKKYLTEQT